MDRRNLILTGASLIALPFLGGAGLAQAAEDNAMPAELRNALERDPLTPVLGNPQGDITLTEFFDYNCPSCRKMLGPIEQLIRADPGLRVVMWEWPMFGDDSENATRVALASMQQGKYLPMHKALLAIKGKADANSAMRAARANGLDIARLERDMTHENIEKHITTSFQLADHMGLVGTPSFIAGNEGAFGEYSVKDMQGMIARARQATSR